MKFAIFGSGFGLYGYLPAIIAGCEQTVCLPNRYRARLATRDDVGQFQDVIEWAEDEHAVLAAADAVIVSQRPSDQENWIDLSARMVNIKALLLEKPLANSPAAALRALDVLEQSGKKFRIAYTFRNCRWASLLRQLPSRENAQPIQINWTFLAHHYAHDLWNWKRSVASGGGALRFYGIHLIGLLAELGYDDVTRSSVIGSHIDECESWSAAFTGHGLPNCSVNVNSQSATRTFSIVRIANDGSKTLLVDLKDPFDLEPTVGKFDCRVGLLTALCRDLIQDPAMSYPWYRHSVRLWHKVERHS